METVSCNVDECTFSLENKIANPNPKKKRKRGKKQIDKEKQEFDQKDGEILTGSSDARADPSGSEVGVIITLNVETVYEKDKTIPLSGSEVDGVIEDNEKKNKGKKKKNKKLKVDKDEQEEDGSAKALQDVDVKHVDDNVSLITDKEKTGELGEGDGVSMENKKDRLRKRKKKERKNKEQEGESRGSNVNELQAKKSLEINQVSVEMGSDNVKGLQDVDVNPVDNSLLDKEKVEVLGEGDGVSMEKKKKRLRKRKKKEQEVESGSINVNELQVEKCVETNQMSIETSSISGVSIKDLDGDNCRKRSRLDGSSEENLEISMENVQNNASFKEMKKKEKLRRKGKQKKSKEQDGECGSSNVTELQVEKCVENNQVSVETSNINVIIIEGLDVENCRKKRHLERSLQSSMEDIQGRSPCCADKGEKVVSLDSMLGQVEVNEQASFKHVDVENPSLEISTESSREKLVLIDSQEAVNLPISEGDICEATLPNKDYVAETSGEMNDVEQQIQDQHVHQTCIDNNCEAQDENPKDELDAPCCADSNSSVLQTCAVVNTDSSGAVCPSKGVVVSKDDVVFDVIDKENKTAQHVQHSLTEPIEVKRSQKKLLILDVNGLLADIIPYENRLRRKPDAVISGKAVFKRPFMDDFLQFCFDNFAVGVWSSRTKRNVEMVVNLLMGNSKEKLLFCWDQFHCTRTKYSTIQNRDKPLVFKELKKLWEKLEPDLPWMKGEYDESNTLLLDDSPYKALLNPAHTAIFPYSYEYTDSKDNSLGPGGDLRVYLEQLALAKNVQEYVQQKPFGQRAITSRNPSWGYYQKVIAAVSSASVTVPR